MADYADPARRQSLPAQDLRGRGWQGL